MTYQEMCDQIKAAEIAYLLEHGDQKEMVTCVPESYAMQFPNPDYPTVLVQSGIEIPMCRPWGTPFLLAVQQEMDALIKDMKRQTNGWLHGDGK